MYFMNESEKELMYNLEGKYKGERILAIKKLEDGEFLLLGSAECKYSVINSNGIRTACHHLSTALEQLFPRIDRISSSMETQGAPITTSLGTISEDNFYHLFAWLLWEGSDKFDYHEAELITQLLEYSFLAQEEAGEERIDFAEEVRWITAKYQQEHTGGKIVLVRKISARSHYILQQVGNQFNVIETEGSQLIHASSDFLAALRCIYPNGGTISAQIVNGNPSSITSTIDTTNIQVFKALLCDLFHKARIEYDFSQEDVVESLYECANIW